MNQEIICQHCKARLTEALWRDQGEYFISCFACGVRNLVSLRTLWIHGYRAEYQPTARTPLPSPTPYAIADPALIHRDIQP